MSNPVNEAIQAAGVIADGAVRTIDALRRELEAEKGKNKSLRAALEGVKGEYVAAVDTIQNSKIGGTFGMVIAHLAAAHDIAAAALDAAEGEVK